jgi:hypothetical protein
MKEELELYDMVLNSEKSFDVNYKQLAISLRAELKETEYRIQKAIEYCENCIFDYERNSMVGYDFVIVEELLKGKDMEEIKVMLDKEYKENKDILRGNDNE